LTTTNPSARASTRERTRACTSTRIKTPKKPIVSFSKMVNFARISSSKANQVKTHRP
jgi:hypothetical protein